MKFLYVYLFSLCLLVSTNAAGQEWKNECVGYYQLELPAGLETALYVITNITHPPKEPVSRSGILVQRTRNPVITFGVKARESGDDRVQAQFSYFNYDNYDLVISSEESNLINLSEYKKRL